MKRISFAIVPSLLVLAACSSEDVENTVVDDVDEIVDDDAEYDPMTRDYTLSEEAQARRDTFDETEFGTEYAGYRDEIVNERDTAESLAAEREREAQLASQDSEGGSTGNASRTSDGSASGSANASSSGGSSGTSATGASGAAGDSMPARDANTNMRARSQMTWSYLDRNDDNRLSVAEYAIWAIPLDPTIPEPNDARPPYVTTEEINKAADSFFYYDIDGDSYLDRREFTAARRGEDFG